MEILSKQQAKALGLSHYFTGKPCKRGHISARNVGSSNCLECWRDSAKSDRERDPDEFKRKKKAEYDRNKTAILEQQATYRKTNWSEIYHRRKADSKYQEYMKTYLASYVPSDEAKAVLAANTRFRQTTKRKQTPGWVDKAERKQIAELYKLARRLTEQTGIKHVVDHIIPLRGELVQGLHCLANLQILTAVDNRSKYNHFDPDSFVP